MADTFFSTNSDQAKKLWMEKQTREMRRAAYFSKFQGGPESLVFTKEDLAKDQGDKMSFGLTMRLAGDGVEGNSTLENNEESLSNYQSTVSLEIYRNAVRSDKMSKQRVAFSIDEESTNALKVWGSEKFDKLCTSSLYSGVTGGTTKTFFGGSASSTGTLTSSDYLTPGLITKVASWASTGGNRQQAPLIPFKVEGGSHYVLLVPKDVGYDLTINTDWKQFHRDLDARGESSPIFTGGLGMISNVVIHECEFLNDLNSSTWGSGNNVAGATCFLLGAGALNVANGKMPEIIEETFDYKFRKGYALEMIMGVKAPVFNSKTYGSVAIQVARTAVSDL